MSAQRAELETSDSPQAEGALLRHLLELILEIGAFAEKRTLQRALRLMVSGLITVGRRWISRMISTSGLDQRDWSADYKLFSRSEWDPADLFEPVIRRTLAMCDDNYFALALDETFIARPGRKVTQSVWMRDPLSPPFHVNFIRGLRFLQFSALPPLHRRYNVSPRGFPVHFEMVPVVKKPGRRATEAARQAYHQAKKHNTLPVRTVPVIQSMREAYDHQGGADKIMIVAVDGSFCNRAIFTADFDRTIIVARARKNASLCWPAPPGSRRIYDTKKFNPEEVRKDSTVRWETVPIFHGGRWRDVRYKELKRILWQGGARRNPLRLLVLAPVPYRITKKGRTFYRQPAYLLINDQHAPIDTLIQAYFDRWQIEVNHRDEKDTLGLGDSQVWSDRSVPRQPAFVVASYSLLLLAALEAYGPHRTALYELLPAWRKPAARPSCLDLVTQLRKEALANEAKMLHHLNINLEDDSMMRKAAG